MQGVTPIKPSESSASPSANGQQIRQLYLQLTAAFSVAVLAWPYYALRNEELPWPHTAFAIAGTALLLASLTRQPWWWRLIHAAFAPLAWGVSQLAIPPGWYLLAFLLLMLIFRGAPGGQVPLYLSNADTAAAIARHIAKRPAVRFVDLGAGVGSLLVPLARERPDSHFTGIENAPLTWLIGRLRSARLSNCTWRWGDLWQIDLSDFDMVHAFLSPTPMAALWQKARQQMPPGSVFISNSFPVPDVEPQQVIEVNDSRRTRLYCYRV
ncbi:MAG: class I SAM-dependent methyltransferase [Candidatus Accumulibacter sp.]|nr:class I SAM-dependent methyltransferase [Accumulibacter sp.]